MTHLSLPFGRAACLRGALDLLRQAAVLLACAGAALGPLQASAQVEIRPVKPAVDSAGAANSQLDLAPLDLGGADADTPPRTATRAQPASTTTAAGPTRAAVRSVSAAPTESKASLPASEAIERVIFDRKPVRVALPVNRERLVTFNQPVALNAPEDIASYARINIVGKTMYVTALMPFGSVRVFVEQLDGEQLQIPLDLVADRSTAAASSEIQIFGRAETSAKTAQNGTGAGAAADKAVDARSARDDADEVSVDAVMLTRYAARRLYAPWRLTGGDPAIHQVPLELKPVPDLYRGARVQTTPIGAWRAGSLWVTAVRMTNLEASPLEIRLEDIRGGWITSTAHGSVLGRAGSETDTTALYLVCDRPFEACR